MIPSKGGSNVIWPCVFYGNMIGLNRLSLPSGCDRNCLLNYIFKVVITTCLGNVSMPICHLVIVLSNQEVTLNAAALGKLLVFL